VAKPAVPWLMSLVLLGTGIASAIGPELGLTLKGLGPRLPFALAGLSLAAITAGMVCAERALFQRRAAVRAAEVETAALPPAAACSAGAWNATSLGALLPLQGLAGAAWGVSLDPRPMTPTGRQRLSVDKPNASGVQGRPPPTLLGCAGQRFPIQTDGHDRSPE
jgi:hypothetical protein